MPLDRQRYVVVGGPAIVTLPDSKTAAGKVESLGQAATSQEGGQAVLQAIVSIADQSAIGTLQSSPVRVKFVSDERKDVLTVPISALLALAEGGYGVQLVEGTATRYVAVETGLFANGRVEIRGSGLQPGMKVGVPG